MTHRIIASTLAVGALVCAQAAAAQQPRCIAARDLGDAVVYTMPIAYDAARTACINRVPRDGFLAVGGEPFVAQFRARQDQAWPGAFRVLKTFMAERGEAGADAEITALVASLPESALRPFVDGLVGQMIADEIKGDSCGKIERGLELISPLPTENVGSLVAFMAELIELKDPPICAAAPAPAAR